MGQYTTWEIVPAAQREELGDGADAYVAGVIRQAAIDAGYEPTGDPELAWDQITPDDVAQHARPPYQAGDWRVQGVVDVADPPPEDT